MGAKLVRRGRVGVGLQESCHLLCPSRTAPAVGQPGDICPDWMTRTLVSSGVAIVFYRVWGSGESG